MVAIPQLDKTADLVATDFILSVMSIFGLSILFILANGTEM